MGIDERGRMSVVGGQHHDGLTAFACSYVRRGDALDVGLMRHRP